MKIISKTILKFINWKTTGVSINDKKIIVLMAPHTSSIDFFMGRMVLYSMKKKSFFLINKKFFFFPFNFLLSAMGGIAVDVNNPRVLISQVKKEFEKRKQITLVIAPEGTRKKTSKWKRGFHFIANNLDIPVYLGTLDYKKKEACFITKFEITKNFNNDIKKIKKHYEDINAKHPEKFDCS